MSCCRRSLCRSRVTFALIGAVLVIGTTLRVETYLTKPFAGGGGGGVVGGGVGSSKTIIIFDTQAAQTTTTTAVISTTTATSIPPPTTTTVASSPSAGDTGTTRRRIGYMLHDKKKLPYIEKFNPYIICGGRRVELPISSFLNTTTTTTTSLLGQFGVLDFTTTVSTNLNILIMGDSVAIQFAQTLQEAADDDDSITRKTAFTGTDTDGKGGKGTGTGPRGEQPPNRKVYRYTRGLHEGMFVLGPVRGGGSVAGWRITGLLRRTAEGQPLPNASKGGWDRTDAHILLNHEYHYQTQKTAIDTKTTTATTTTTTTASLLEKNINNDSNNNNVTTIVMKTIKQMDAVIYRVPHGWIKFKDINRESIFETIELCHELFHATTVVFVNIPFSNNVETVHDLKRLDGKNRLLRSIADEWMLGHDQDTSSNNGGGSGGRGGGAGVQNIMILDLASFSHALIQANARAIGYFDMNVVNDDNTVTTVHDVDDNLSSHDDDHTITIDNHRPSLIFNTDDNSTQYFVLDRLSTPENLPRSIPHVCGQKVPTGSQNCKKNFLSMDGMHWCMTTVGGRINAGIACLLGCAFNRNNNNDDRNNSNSTAGGKEESSVSSTQQIRACERNCNERFMSLKAIDQSMLEQEELTFP